MNDYGPILLRKTDDASTQEMHNAHSHMPLRAGRHEHMRNHAMFFTFFSVLYNYGLFARSICVHLFIHTSRVYPIPYLQVSFIRRKRLH